MRHYCTLFDSRYAAQGLALYESLMEHSSEPFTLHVLAMDLSSELDLMTMKLFNVKVHTLLQLQHLVPGLTWQEYCWSCASQFTLYLISGRYDITYIDADLFFFSDPAPVFSEIGERSIAITPHRLIPSKKHLEVNGKFNVGFVHFKNTYAGRECLSQWASDVRAKCSVSDGCGDQKYLDVWPLKYGKDCCIIENIGVNAGPWSIANWDVTDGPMLGFNPRVPLIAYHFHEYVHRHRLTNYELRSQDRTLIYEPYIAAVDAAKERIASLRLQSV